MRFWIRVFKQEPETYQNPYTNVHCIRIQLVLSYTDEAVGISWYHGVHTFDSYKMFLQLSSIVHCCKMLLFPIVAVSALLHK